MVSENDSLLERSSRVKLWSEAGVFPALQLQWLGVHRTLHRQGIGKITIGKVIDVFYQSIIDVGTPALICRALNRNVADFYRKLGFVDYGPLDPMPRLLLPAESVVELKKMLSNEVGKV